MKNYKFRKLLKLFILSVLMVLFMNFKDGCGDFGGIVVPYEPPVPPNPPILVSPPDADTGVVIHCFNWTSQGLTSNIQISDNPLFSNLLADSVLSENSTCFRTDLFQPYTWYNWRVKATGLGGVSGWSQVFRFKTGAY